MSLKITVLYVGSSLLAPLKNAEREINRAHGLDLQVAAYNFGSPLSDREWQEVDRDLAESNIVFVIHVMDGENASRLVAALESYKDRHDAVVVINCMPDLMRLTRMGKLDVGKFAGWMGRYVRQGKTNSKHRHHHYLKLVDRLPSILKFVPTAGALTDAKNYLYLFCYFLQPTPANIQSMLLYALKYYVRDDRLRCVKTATPQQVPSVAIYHPDASELFETFEDYKKWYGAKKKRLLNPESTLGLLLMRPQVVSKTTKHYDALIHAIENEGLDVIPAIATLMDNREAVTRFFNHGSKKISQIVSLTGFSFVGGPAMNDSAAAAEFLRELNVPYRSAVSLDTQTIEAWRESLTGLNPIQAGMQIAIPEIDGATEPFIYGGIPIKGQEPAPLDDRCARLARRLKRWNNLRTARRDEIKLALVLFCFPPNKGNIGTAADLDVFPSVWDLLKRLANEGYRVDVPSTPEELRERLLGGNSEQFGVAANVAHRMTTSEYLRLCSYVRDVEKDWGTAPGSINSFGRELLIQGLTLGNVFIGVQPTFGFEGDPMRLMMARSGSPHHGFMAFYTYLSQVFKADGIIHFGTHGALEFMPGKQIGLSSECWPDRLIGELPNFYVYSVNNPSEGSIAKRRSYAELISYLTPPIENAGLYRELAQLKDQIMAYRQSQNENEREKLFESIQALSQELHFG
ncbi:MAG TPA: cobaltochelatase subunit CobN [Pyrinomonadaceae bacterium]|nr:cobaltochelatase subunit CobN [Pyrinomonadaceae bacterium]